MTTHRLHRIITQSRPCTAISVLLIDSSSRFIVIIDIVIRIIKECNWDTAIYQQEKIYIFIELLILWLKPFHIKCTFYFFSNALFVPWRPTKSKTGHMTDSKDTAYRVCRERECV